MKHPTTAGVDWQLLALVYEESGAGIAIALFSRNNETETSLGFRWLTDKTFFGKETEWILLPSEFSRGVAMKLAAKGAAGMRGLQRKGMRKMLNWLVDQEELLPFIEF